MYCRMHPLEHSAILSTCIKLPFSIKSLVFSIFKWPLKTGFTVQCIWETSGTFSDDDCSSIWTHIPMEIVILAVMIAALTC